MAILDSGDPLGSSSFVLVTGGAGFIGHHLVRALLEAGHAVRVLDDLSTGTRANLPQHPNLDFQPGSILDREAVATAARGAGSIVHLAGLVGMRLVTRRPALAYRTTVEGTRNLLRATRAPIALLSSSAVYGIEAETDTQESLPIHRSAPLAYDGGRPGYATGKWQMERMAQDAARDGRNILVVRPFNVVGHGQRSDSGMVLPRFIELARRGEPLTVYGDGMQTRCFTEVGVFADRHRAPAALQRGMACKFQCGERRQCDVEYDPGDRRNGARPRRRSRADSISKRTKTFFPGRWTSATACLTPHTWIAWWAVSRGRNCAPSCARVGRSRSRPPTAARSGPSTSTTGAMPCRF